MTGERAGGDAGVGDGAFDDEAVADDPLAVRVEKPRAEIAIESLRAEGVYDDGRRVCEFDAETIALPVTAPPTETRIREVIRQVDPEPRTRHLADALAERGWSDEEIGRAPGSWATIGSVALVTIPDDCPDEAAVAEALLELDGRAETVLADEGVAGRLREPQTRHLAGERDTETVHVEDGIRYGLDPARVMFSPGNQAERVRMGEVVDDGERVFDMFAGIGYFTLPMARAGARVTATEINPAAFRYLLENAMANDVADRVDAYRADCRAVAGELDPVDRVVMGYYGSEGGGAGGDGGGGDRDDSPAPHDGHRTEEGHAFLPDALAALRSGGVVHYHEATPESRYPERPLERLERAVDREGRSMTVLDRRRVKTHSAGVVHVVVDVRVD